MARYSNYHPLGRTLLAFMVFVLNKEEQVIGQTYPNSPDSDPPSQWASMSNNFKDHCSPFGVSIFAKGWERSKFVHACNVMAQMLDNDQDGCADDADVVKSIRATQSGMAMFKTENSANYELLARSFNGQGLFDEETEPGCSGSSETGSCRDAAIEEIMHVITAKGIGPAYPDDFSDCYTNKNNLSTMQVQMDVARGGHFPSIPNPYPEGSIYHYDDRTCDYGCMGTEFIYWAITSLLNGQDARAEDNSQEWEANTPAELQSKLPGMYNLLLNNPTSMKLLSSSGELPGTNSNTGATGTYKPSSQTCANGCGLDGSGCGQQGNDPDIDICEPSPRPPTSSPPSPTPPTGGELNGEEACEEKGYTRNQCLKVGDGSCCQWDDNSCWSKIGQNLCPGTGTPTPPTPTPPTPTPPTNDSCEDSVLKFKVRKNGGTSGKFISRNCNWVSNQPKRCKWEGVSSHCLKTCTDCSICEDAELKFKVTLNGKVRAKNCDWVDAKATSSRCKKTGVSNTCPVTCEVCTASSIFG